MTIEGQGSLAERLAGVEEIECVTPDLNGVPRGKVMTGEGFLSGRRLQLARGVLLQCIMGGYPPARFYGSDDGDLALVAEPTQVHRLALEQHSARLRHLRCAGTGWHAVRAVHPRPAQAGGGALRRPRLATGGGHRTGVLRLRPEHRSQRAVPGPLGRMAGASWAIRPSACLQQRPAAVLRGRYRCMDALGLVRDTFMHEMGTSQFEINFLHGDPVLLADQTFLFKHLLKEVALKHGLIVVCMAAAGEDAGQLDAHPPEHRRTGRRAKHLQRSRWRAFRRVPPLHRRPAGLPGGLHALLRAACELLPAPLPSLRFAEQRLLVPRQPRRRPAHPGQRSFARRVENRLPGADANPYLAIAASLAAGLYGLEHELEPSPAIQGEFEVPEELTLPCTMYDALRRLRRRRWRANCSAASSSKATWRPRAWS